MVLLMSVPMLIARHLFLPYLSFPSPPLPSQFHVPPPPTHPPCHQSEEYASWAAGCRMVMKGRPLAKSGYEQELASIRSFIAMQNSSGSSTASAAADKVGSGHIFL